MSTLASEPATTHEAESALWEVCLGEGPLVAAAIHHGHFLRPEVARRMALDEATRRREEDPYTGGWTWVAPNRVVVHLSRFEVDLNRPREKAVYAAPQDAWGLRIWREPPDERIVAGSLALYDAFYKQIRALLEQLTARYDRVVVLDLHAYNHRRRGPQAPPDDLALNPEINLGTGTMDRSYWAPVVEGFLEAMRSCDFFGRRLDVRENVKFVGRQFPHWIHRTFPRRVCCLAVEVKKFFMDEWTGEVDEAVHAALGKALQGAADRITEMLGYRA